MCIAARRGGGGGGRVYRFLTDKRQHLLLTAVLYLLGKTYCPGGYESQCKTQLDNMGSFFTQDQDVLLNDQDKF